MEYKGYLAKVEYDASVSLLHASVINSGAYPVANCEAADAESLRREFRISIDEYLASCDEDGVEPRKPLDARAGRVNRSRPAERVVAAEVVRAHARAGYLAADSAESR